MAAGRPSKLRVEIEADSTGVDKGVKKASGRFALLAGGMAKLGGVAGVAMAAVGAATVGAAVSAVKSASALEQSMGAVSTVFGKSADQVKAYADTASTRLGLARSEYATLATAVGTSMQNMGKSQAEAAGLTDQLIGRASDLAATFGGTTTEATQALGAAFRGEFDSVERLGISLKASDISAELAARGQSKLTGEALKNAQGQATLDLIMKQTAKTAGAFGRESNTLAGQQQRLRAQFDNVKASIGARLIPVLVAVASWVSGTVFPAMARLGGFISGTLGPAIRSYLSPVVAGLSAAFQRVAGTVRDNQSSFARLQGVLSGVGAVIRAVAPVVGSVLGFAFQAAGHAVSVLVGGLSGLIGIADRIIGKFQEMGDRVSAAVDRIRGAGETIGNVVGKIPGLSLQLTTGRPDLVGGLGGLTIPGAGMIQASSSLDPLAYSLGAGAGRTHMATRAGGVINMPVTINGALDPVAVARQLEKVLRDQTLRLGRVPAYAW